MCKYHSCFQCHCLANSPVLPLLLAPLQQVPKYSLLLKVCMCKIADPKYSVHLIVNVCTMYMQYVCRIRVEPVQHVLSYSIIVFPIRSH